MLTFLQRCCAQFKKSTQSLEHVNLFQEAIPFASAASLAQRRSFMPHESISIILKMRPSATIFNESLSLAILDESQR